MIKTEQAKYSPELQNAVEQALRAHNLRLKPGIDLGHVLDTLVANGVTPEAKYGQLCLTMSGSPIHSADALEGLARQRTELFIPRDSSAVRSRDELDKAGKVQFIREQGLAKWEALPQSAPAEAVVTLDRNRLTKTQWLTLDRKTRAELSGMWGSDAVGQIMQRRK